jgi:hypothetical protein
MGKDQLAESPAGRRWTRPDDYIDAMARRRTARRAREVQERTQPDAPRFSLSTLPFLALLFGLAVLSVAIILAAWPGSHPQQKQKAPVKEQGYAAKGWFEEAKKQFH